jgi:hypothetical protein
MENPKLIEPGIKNYLYTTLNRCHSNRVQIYTTMLNIIVVVIFIAVVGITLYYCYKRKLSPNEQYQKMMKEQEYILSKIRFYQDEKQGSMLSNITNLPVMEEDRMELLRV